MIGARAVPRTSAPRNIVLQILAVCLSIFLWGFVRFTQTPFSATITQAQVQVPLDVVTDPEMIALEVPQTVSLTVRGSEDAVQGMKPNALGASVDLRGKSEGLLFPTVTVTRPPELNVVSVDPERLSIHLVPVVTQSFAVEARLAGHVAQGYSATPPSLRTTTVNVKGPRNYVQTVKTVNAVVNLSNTETGIMQRVLLEPRDEDGNLVRNVQVSPESEIVTVNVTPAVVPRMLPVFPSFSGAVSKEYSFESAWSPRVLPLVFDKGSSDTAPAALFTTPIDISRLGPGDHKLTVAVAPPSGATLVKDKEIQVTVKVHAAKKAAAPPSANKAARSKPH